MIDLSNRELLFQGHIEDNNEFFVSEFHKYKYIEKIKVLDNLIFNNEQLILLEISKNLNQVIDFITINNFLSRFELEELDKHNLNIMQSSNVNSIKRNLPKPPSNVIIPQIDWEILLTSIQIQLYPLLIGAKGSGKTTIAKAAAMALNYKFYALNCSTLLKPKQSLIGMTNSDKGSTFLTKSLFLKHYTSDDNVVIFLDELSRTPTIASNYMMTILDKIQSYIYIEDLGEVVYKGPNVTFIAAANFGFQYTDTRTQDAAFLDRFIRMKMNYLSASQEINLIKQEIPGIDEKQLEILVRCAHACRDNQEQLQNSVSTRQLIYMSQLLNKGFTLEDIIFNVFVNLFNNGDIDESETVLEILKAVV